MRQNPVGEPAATAALNFGTPRRRSSLKRLCPFCHCRQRYERNLRRIHASRFVSTRGDFDPFDPAAAGRFPQAIETECLASAHEGSPWCRQLSVFTCEANNQGGRTLSACTGDAQGSRDARLEALLFPPRTRRRAPISDPCPAGTRRPVPTEGFVWINLSKW